MEATPQTDAPEIGLVGRMLRVFYAPGEAFALLARTHSKADWLVPVALSAIMAVVVAQQVMPIAMKASMAQMEEELKDMPAEQREMVEKMMGGQEGGIMGKVGMVTAPIMTLLMLFVAGGLLLLFAKLMGSEATYGQMLPVYAYGSLIGLVKAIVVTPLMLSKETIVIQTGLGILFSDELLQTFAGRFLSMFELFTVWQAVITAMGLAIVGRISMGKATAGVFAVVIVFVAIGAALAGLQAALGG
jgi:hypothetical protein